MAGLLVSVRSVREAEAALLGGATLIDVKEPLRGPLGRADDATLAAVLRAVAGRRPVSAARGELLEESFVVAEPGLSYVKWGLAGCGRRGDWQRLLQSAALRLARSAPGCRAVAVSYADWERAEAPRPEAIAAFALEQRWEAFLIDTWHKDGRSLLDWLSLPDVKRLCRLCQGAGVRVALAGSLTAAAIERLRDVEPDWFAVRGAACLGGCRLQGISVEGVRPLAEAVQGDSCRPGTPGQESAHNRESLR